MPQNYYIEIRNRLDMLNDRGDYRKKKASPAQKKRAVKYIYDNVTKVTESRSYRDTNLYSLAFEALANIENDFSINENTEGKFQKRLFGLFSEMKDNLPNEKDHIVALTVLGKHACSVDSQSFELLKDVYDRRNKKEADTIIAKRNIFHDSFSIINQIDDPIKRKPFVEDFKSVRAQLINDDNDNFNRELFDYYYLNIGPEMTSDFAKGLLMTTYSRSNHTVILKKNRQIEEMEDEEIKKSLSGQLAGFISDMNDRYKIIVRSKKVSIDLGDGMDAYTVAIDAVAAGSEMENTLVDGLLNFCDETLSLTIDATKDKDENVKIRRQHCQVINASLGTIIVDSLVHNEPKVSSENKSKIENKIQETSMFNKILLRTEELYASSNQVDSINILSQFNEEIETVVSRKTPLSPGVMDALYDNMNCISSRSVTKEIFSSDKDDVQFIREKFELIKNMLPSLSK